jgi:hypothetical protein
MRALLDYPQWIFATSLVSLVLAARLGWYVERRWSPLKSEERQEFRTVLAATLTLLGLLIGFSFSMAVNRYDLRQHFEEMEANAIGTEYLRAALLPPAAAETVRRLLKTYVGQRIRFYEEWDEGIAARISNETLGLQNEMWLSVESAAAVQATPIVALVAEGMNDVFNAQGSAQAASWNRIPIAAWALMISIGIACCALVGYGGHGTRAWILLILPLVLSIALFLIADVDTPRQGLIRVLPQNLISLSQSIRSS